MRHYTCMYNGSARSLLVAVHSPNARHGVEGACLRHGVREMSTGLLSGHQRCGLREDVLSTQLVLLALRAVVLHVARGFLVVRDTEVEIQLRLEVPLLLVLVVGEQGSVRTSSTPEAVVVVRRPVLATVLLVVEVELVHLGAVFGAGVLAPARVFVRLLDVLLEPAEVAVHYTTGLNAQG